MPLSTDKPACKPHSGDSEGEVLNGEACGFQADGLESATSAGTNNVFAGDAKSDACRQCTYRDYSHLAIKQDDESLGRDSSKANDSKDTSFPAKLHLILSNPAYGNIVCWLPHGRSWKVLDPIHFEKLILPLFFSHGKISSFMRQVSGYGFHRIRSGPDVNSYYHELFLRGLPQLCDRMRRVGASGGGAKKKGGACKARANCSRASQDDEHRHHRPPDFYKISRLHPLPQTSKPPAGTISTKTVGEVVSATATSTATAVSNSREPSNREQILRESGAALARAFGKGSCSGPKKKHGRLTLVECQDAQRKALSQMNELKAKQYVPSSAILSSTSSSAIPKESGSFFTSVLSQDSVPAHEPEMSQSSRPPTSALARMAQIELQTMLQRPRDLANGTSRHSVSAQDVGYTSQPKMSKLSEDNLSLPYGSLSSRGLTAAPVRFCSSFSGLDERLHFGSRSRAEDVSEAPFRFGSSLPRGPLGESTTLGSQAEASASEGLIHKHLGTSHPQAGISVPAPFDQVPMEGYSQVRLGVLSQAHSGIASRQPHGGGVFAAAAAESLSMSQLFPLSSGSGPKAHFSSGQQGNIDAALLASLYRGGRPTM